MDWILGWILSPIYNLIYYIFIYGPLWLLNSFWQIFTWFSGLSIGKIFFNNNSSTSVNFNIDWNSDLTKVFLAFVVVGVIVFIITLIITQLAHLFKNKISDTTLEMKTTPARSLKWIVIFPIIIFIIPFGMVLLSFFTSLLTQLVSSAFSYIDSSLGTSAIEYNLTSGNITYFHNLVTTYSFGTYNNANLIGLNGFMENVNQDVISSALSDLKGIDQSKLSDDNANLVSDAIEKLNLLSQTDLGQWDYMHKIASILSNLSATKDDNLANQLQNALASYNGSSGIIYNLQMVGQDITQLINRNVIGTDSTPATNVATFNSLFGSDSNFMTMFGLDNVAAEKFGDNNAISLVSLPSYIYTTSTQTNNTFFGTIFIYQFVTGQTDTNWSTAGYYNFGVEGIARMFAGFVAVIAAMILMLLYVLFLTKRIIELACYFVLSPVVAATAVWDEGGKLTAWLKLVIVKMFSIVTLNVTFQIFYIIYPIVKSLAIDGLAGDNFLGIVPFSDLFNIFFIVAGLVAAYFATTKLSKFMGDDSSIAETFAEVAVLGTAFNAAKGITKAAYKGGKKLHGKLDDAVRSKGRQERHGDKYFDSKGNVKRFGSQRDRAMMTGQRQEYFQTMQRDGQVTIGSTTFYKDNFEKQFGKNSFEEFIKSEDVWEAQKEKWAYDNDMVMAGDFGGKSKWKEHWRDRQEHRNK